MKQDKQKVRGDQSAGRSNAPTTKGLDDKRFQEPGSTCCPVFDDNRVRQWDRAEETGSRKMHEAEVAEEEERRGKRGT